MVVNDTTKNFPLPFGDKYYLVDAGYANRKGYLAPYKKCRYHFQLFRGAAPPENDDELFNQAYSSLRSVIERTFGVWKNRFAILKNMPCFNISDQAAIVGGSMSIHNFIQKNTKQDEDEEFAAIEFDDNFVLEKHSNENVAARSTAEDPNMDKQRDMI